MAKSVGPRSNWLTTTVGVVLSIALGVLFYFRTDIKTALAVFAGLLGVGIALQLEILLDSRRLAISATSRDRMAAQIEAVDWLPSALGEILDALHAVPRTSHSPLAMDLARMEFEHCRERLRDLQRGFIDEVRSTEDALTGILTARVRRNLRATSGKGEIGWWLGLDANLYLQRQAKAVQRGVRVERVFIYDTWTPVHEKVVARQRDLGVKTFRVHENRVRDVRSTELIIWDDECALIGEFNPAGEFVNGRILLEQAAVRNLGDTFQVIRSIAEAWPPAAAP